MRILCPQMVELCSKLEMDVAAIDGTNAGLEARGADLVNRASDLHARIDVCGARALHQVCTNLTRHDFSVTLDQSRSLNLLWNSKIFRYSFKDRSISVLIPKHLVLAGFICKRCN
jgi:hypothetical protein